MERRSVGDLRADVTCSGVAVDEKYDAFWDRWRRGEVVCIGKRQGFQWSLDVSHASRGVAEVQWVSNRGVSRLCYLYSCSSFPSVASVSYSSPAIPWKYDAS